MGRMRSVGQTAYYGIWFLKGLLGSKRPLVNTMVITYHCNLKCKHCHIAENLHLVPQPHSISYDEAVEEMKASFERGTRVLFFEGGEPTHWRDGEHDLLDLIKAGKEIGYFVTGYTTNGTQALYTQSDVISVSLDGPREVHDGIRCPGTYDALMANLEKVDHPNIFANMVVMPENKHLLRETVQIVKDNQHINGLMLNFLTPPPEPKVLTLEEKRKVVEEALELKREGYPILNSRKALRELLIEDYSERCPFWASEFVMPDRSKCYGCPMRGESCRKCGFNAVREYSLITRGSLTTIMSMAGRFGLSTK
ncbi:MAG: radical SAM protein [Methanomassiliicoccales archaeon]|nr:radical SAM protein [Methanomassiliicoccales archaeon]